MSSLDQDHHYKDQILQCDLDHLKDLQNKRELWPSDQRFMIFPSSSGGPMRSKSRILDSIWSGAFNLEGFWVWFGNSIYWYVMCQNYCYYMDSLQVSFLQVTASNIVQDTTLTAQSPFSTSAYWIMIYLISLICDLNFPPNPESFHIEIPLQRRSNILDLLIMRPAHI